MQNKKPFWLFRSHDFYLKLQKFDSTRLKQKKICSLVFNIAIYCYVLVIPMVTKHEFLHTVCDSLLGLILPVSSWEHKQNFAHLFSTSNQFLCEGPISVTRFSPIVLIARECCFCSLATEIFSVFNHLSVQWFISLKY